MCVWDRKGKQVSMLDWVLLTFDPSYRVLESTNIGTDSVVTIWVGVPHGFDNDQRPLIFETAVYEDGSRLLPGWTRHYATERDACSGHGEICKQITDDA